MRLGAISFLFLVGCGRPRDPAIEILRLPQTAYGPFDASAVRVVADAGPDVVVKEIPSSQVSCVVVVPEDLDENTNTADAPFDNCPVDHEGGHFNEKATSQRRTQGNRNTCCYSIVRRKPRVITIPEVD